MERKRFKKTSEVTFEIIDPFSEVVVAVVRMDLFIDPDISSNTVYEVSKELTEIFSDLDKRINQRLACN